MKHPQIVEVAVVEGRNRPHEKMNAQYRPHAVAQRVGEIEKWNLKRSREKECRDRQTMDRERLELEHSREPKEKHPKFEIRRDC